MLDYELKPDKKTESSSEYEIDDSLITGNPFPGLRPFGIDECHYFFGRESQVDEILVKLAQNQFVTVMGYSGSGKSSLMYCGVLPVLYGGFMTNTGANWNVIATRPGVSPIDNLAESIIKSDPSNPYYTEEEYIINKAVVASLLRGNTKGLQEAIEQRYKKHGENTLILIDQFEELFRFQEDYSLFEDARNYINILMEACRNSASPVYVAITMRSDYIGQCSKFPGLTQLINQSNYLVPQMTRDQKRVAIEGPIAVGGGKISKRLVKRLLNEIGEDQDQLPILQHALMRTWDFWIENRDKNEPLDIRHYNAVGKISEALSQHANEAYDELSVEEKEIAEVLFKSLTEKTNDNYGLRRPARLGQVATITGASEEDVIKVIDKFRKPGRSFLMPAAHIKLHSESIIEISHESLMRIWARLRAWVDEEYESAQMYRRLSEAAAMYQIGRTGLWRPPDLQLALNWQKKQRPSRFWAQRYDEAFERAIVFLDTSRITYEAEQKNQEMLQKRLLRRTRIVAVILGAFAIVALIFFIYGITQQIEAERNLATAEIQKDRAVKAAEEADEQKQVAQRQEDIAKTRAKEAEDAREKMEQAFVQLQQQKDFAQMQKNIAEEQAQIATTRQQEAQQSEENARESFRRAEQQFNRAQDLLYQSIAQSMAVKSLNIEDDNLKGLLTQQAYLFNKNHNGRVYDPYIYEGLYYAIDQLKGKSYTTLPIKHRNSVRSIVIDNSGEQIFSTGASGRVIKSSIAESDERSILLENNHPNRVLALSYNGQWLLCGTDSTNVEVINLSTGEPSIVKGHNTFIKDIDFIPGTLEFLSADGSFQLRRGSVKNNSSELVKKTNYIVEDIAISSNELVALGSLDGQVAIMSLDGSNEKIIYQNQGIPIHSVRFSPDGKLLAFGSENGIVRIYDLEKNTLKKEFTGHKGRVSDIDFSRDGKLMASASFDGTIQMWSIENLDELPVVMRDNDDYVWDLSFTDDGDYILAACNDGEIRKWPTNPKTMADQFCDILERNLTQEEWDTYVGNDIDYENTCLNLLLDDY